MRVAAIIARSVVVKPFTRHLNKARGPQQEDDCALTLLNNCRRFSSMTSMANTPATMKNSRSLTAIEELIEIQNLPSDPPPEDSLFWRLWSKSEDIAQEALATDFVQGISKGTLDPTAYGGFSVSDAYYCFHGADDYLDAANRATDPVLKAYLQSKYKSYKTYDESLADTWHVKDGSSIVPSSVCKEYSNFESSVCQDEDPIYAVIVMLPCEYLWAWLGGELSPAAPGNLYAKWISDNNYPQGAYKMGNFLVEWQKNQTIDEDKALQIYQKAMTYEWQNFAIATKTK